MSDIVIKAENLGKKYTIGHQAENGGYVALREVLMQNARSLWHKTKDLVQGKPIILGDTLEEVWALKEVSFAKSSAGKRWAFLRHLRQDRHRPSASSGAMARATLIKARGQGARSLRQAQCKAEDIEPHHRAERRAGEHQTKDAGGR